MTELTEEIKREIGQHFVFGFHGHDVSEDIKTLICDYYLGNVILMKRNVQNLAQVHEVVRKLQLLAKEAGHARPLMIGIDQENGLVSALSSSVTPDAGTQFPGAMALAATGSPKLAKEVTAASAKEMRLAGINWAYSPVADVNSDPRNPVIGVRSFGDDPAEVAQYVQAVSQGLTSQKVAPSAKHFPGHGNTHVDSHLSLPRILTSKEALKETELVPFQKLVDDKIATIMTGHMALPLVTGDDTPCSLSRAITTDLLRGDMGFDGVIVTDCLEMEAVAETYGAEGGAVMALQAGADIVMICHRFHRHVGALKATYTAVQEGKLSLDELKASGTRINALKDIFAGSWDDILSSAFEQSQFSSLKEDSLALSRRAYAASIAIIRDPDNILPLQNGPAVLFTPRVESINLAIDDAEGQLRDNAGRVRNTAGPSYRALAEFIAQHAPVQHIVYAPEDRITPELEGAIRSASSIIIAIRNAFERGAWQIEYLRKVMEFGGPAKVALLSTCAPYDLLYLEDIAAPCVATFEFTVPALEAAVGVLFGEESAQGKIPVRRTL